MIQKLCAVAFSRSTRPLRKGQPKFRLQGYLDQLQSKGYFVYSGHRFYANGDLYSANSEQIMFSLHTDRLCRSENPFQLTIQHPSDSLMSRIKSWLQTDFIDLKVDRDIFFLLLEQQFHIALDGAAAMRIAQDLWVKSMAQKRTPCTEEVSFLCGGDQI